MSERPVLPTEARVLAALRGAGRPLALDELVEYLPASMDPAAQSSRRWLRNGVLSRPEVAHVARGLYVYLPDHITGSTLRLPLIGSEVMNALWWAPPELAYAFWFDATGWRSFKEGVRATCVLPDGRRSTLTTQGVLFWAIAIAPGEELRDWLKEERVAAGDSLLFQVTDSWARLSRVTLERLAQRDAPRVAERSRQLADLAADVLREARRSLTHSDMASWLLARDAYQDPCPPDPLLVVLSRCDDRFAETDSGELTFATKWDRLRQKEEELRQLLAEMASVGPRRKQPDYDLQPWLEAVGYRDDRAASSSPVSEAEQIAAWSSRVYRLRTALKQRKSLWRTFEIRGDQTLGELDLEIRRAFQHDTFDHLSEFYVRGGGRRGKVGLGEIFPDGDSEAAERRLGELELSRGDELSYVYDFGDWIEHTIKVEAVGPAEPDADYPREVARNNPQYQDCVACAARGKKVRATWICIDCSNERQEDVLVCESCLRRHHEEHYADEIVY
jgi:Plasmid pRiA4b ORF-3-like protein/snRNA-activating protein complex (SNAPc), subunit 3